MLLFERMYEQRSSGVFSWIIIRRLSTFLLVLIGWVVFRAENIDQALVFYRAMFSLTGSELTASVALTLTNKNLIILCISAFVITLPHDR